MKALLLCIQLFLLLSIGGQHSFAETRPSAPILQKSFDSGEKITSASAIHTSVFEVVVLDVEEETHSGNQVKDNTAKPFAVKNISSSVPLHAASVNSIGALKAVPLHFVASTRIPSYPIYITNRVLRL